MTTQPITAVVPHWRDWRTWPDRVAYAWRHSLRFRTLVVTLGLTASTILIALVWMALAIQNDLFDSRARGVQDAAGQATVSAQTILDAAVVDGDSLVLQSLMDRVNESVRRQAGTDQIAMFRISDAPSSIAPQDVLLGGITADMISDELRETVRRDAAQQWWQSIGIPTPAREFPRQ